MKYVDYVYDIVKKACEGFDAVYEDHIIELVGIAGFNELRTAKLLLSCGSINERRLYTLEKK